MNFAVGISKIEKGNEREICESVDDRMNVQKARDIIYGRRK